MRKLIVIATLIACIPPSPPKVPLPPLPDRSERIETTAPIDGLEIAATPYGSAGWRVKVKNDTDATVTVVWDESSFVSRGGSSGGRLIRGNTRRIDVAKAQPSTPVPPNASAMEVAFIEDIIEAEKNEATYAEHDAKYGGVSPEMERLIVRQRSSIKKLIAGGTMHVTVQLSDGKKTWSGRVVD
jgi:hypothetical protein